jgi:hypothetical protein
MDTVRRDQHEIEALLRVLEWERDLFRRAAATSLQTFDDAFRDILNEQRVSRETFDDVARGFSAIPQQP